MFADNVTLNLCCQIRADNNSSTCTFTMGKSVTCTGTCANEIIPYREITRFLTKRKKDVMLEFHILYTVFDSIFLTKKFFLSTLASGFGQDVS